MSLTFVKGNLFNSNAQTLVNTVNCVGIMGKGIALEFRLRYPEMFKKYAELCQQNLFDIGKLWIYKTQHRNILNFPTKIHWRDPSKPEYLIKGLEKFLTTYREKGVSSIAFPLLGTINGKIPINVSRNLMTEYLSKCDITVEIYEYDPTAADDLSPIFQTLIKQMHILDSATLFHISEQLAKQIKSYIDTEPINSISALKDIKGMGLKTLERMYQVTSSYIANNASG